MKKRIQRIGLTHFWPIAVFVSFSLLFTTVVATFVQQLEQQNLQSNFEQVARTNALDTNRTSEPAEALVQNGVQPRRVNNPPRFYWFVWAGCLSLTGSLALYLYLLLDRKHQSELITQHKQTEEALR
jgi:hypothetical protein